MKYSDIVKIKNLPSVFDLQGEIENNWNQFISNTQFEEVLGVVVHSFSKNPTIKQKSIWMTGTYGTGKSHASSVIKHLMCDPIDDIVEYIDESIMDKQLRFTIKSHRSKKRYFPVILKGGEGVKDENTFAMAIEKAVKTALKSSGITIHLQSDFESIVEFINTKTSINWDNIILESKDLRNYVKSKQQLVDRLNNSDMEILGYVKDALVKDKIDLGTLTMPIDEWIMAVQNELRSQGVSDGLLIIWDEFTEIVKSNIPGLLVALQDIADRSMHPENDSFLYLIGHPSSFNNIHSDEHKKINDRFHVRKYQMNQVSTYAIMAKKMKIEDKEMFDALRAESLNICEVIALKLIEGNIQAKNDLLNLFPIHPYTAFLSTFCATNIGSSERSVFDFMLSNPNFKSFFDDEEKFEQKALMTADFLWDFYYQAFLDDPRRMSHITDRYSKNIEVIKNQGKSFESVFKSILLLNSLSNLAQNSGVIPSEQNLQFLFYGAKLDTSLSEVLQFIHENRIVQRLPNGLYSIEGATFSPQEVEEAMRTLREEYRTAVKVLLYGEKALERIGKTFENLLRAYSLAHFSIEDNRTMLTSRIIREFVNKPQYQLHIASFYALNDAEINNTKIYLEELSEQEENNNKIFLLYKSPLESQYYEQFIETMASMTVAAKHKMADQVASFRGHAQSIIEDWQKRMSQQHALIFFRGEMTTVGVQSMCDLFNNTHIPSIFNNGIEILPGIRKAPATFWRNALTISAVEYALSYPTLETTELKLIGSAQPAKLFLKDQNGSSYIVKQDLSYFDISNQDYHPLVLVQKKVDEILKKAAKNNVTFNIAEKLKELSQPPYGLYTNFPNMFVLGFAMRRYRGELYDGTLNKPMTDQQVVDLVVDIFKSWAGNGSKLAESKLIVRFGSKEEKELAKKLVELLHLNNLPGEKDLSDFTSVKNVILINGFCKSKNTPFWVINYLQGLSDPVKGAIEKIALLLSDTSSNQNYIFEALDAIKTYQMDLSFAIHSPNSFDEGYKYYLMGIDDVFIKEEEVSEVRSYISSKMNPEVGFWNETDVRDKAKSWRLSKTMPQLDPQPNPQQAQLVTYDYPNFTNDGGTQPISQIRTQLVQKVNQIQDIDKIRELIIALIQEKLIGDEILNKIDKLC